MKTLMAILFAAIPALYIGFGCWQLAPWFGVIAGLMFFGMGLDVMLKGKQ